MDNLDFFKRNLIKVVHVLFHGFRNSDDSVGILVRGFFYPGTAEVCSTQLFRLPWPVRFQRMGRQNQRHLMQLLDKQPREMAVPCMAVHHVYIAYASRHDNILKDGIEEFFVFFVFRSEEHTSEL